METTAKAEAPASAETPATEPAGPTPLPLMEPEDYRTKCAGHVFRSPESLKYFVRQHRDELIERGAIRAPIGRQMIEPAAFEAAVMSIGQRLAASLRR